MTNCQVARLFSRIEASGPQYPENNPDQHPLPPLLLDIYFLHSPGSAGTIFCITLPAWFSGSFTGTHKSRTQAVPTQTKPIQGAPGIYEARVEMDYRMTYQRDANDTLMLRVVGKHDEALKKP